MFFSFVCVVMLISPLFSVSRVVRERAAEVGLPYKRVCTMISDVPSVNTRRFVHRPHGEFRGRPMQRPMLHRNRTSRSKRVCTRLPRNSPCGLCTNLRV